MYYSLLIGFLFVVGWRTDPGLIMRPCTKLLAVDGHKLILAHLTTYIFNVMAFVPQV